MVIADLNLAVVEERKAITFTQTNSKNRTKLFFLPSSEEN